MSFGSVRSKSNAFFAKANHVRLAKNQKTKSSIDTEPPIVTYAGSFVAVVAQPVTVGDDILDAFPSGVENTANYVSTAGTIASAVRQYSVNGGEWQEAGVGTFDVSGVVTIRVLVTDSETNTAFFPAVGGSSNFINTVPAADDAFFTSDNEAFLTSDDQPFLVAA